MKPSTQNIAQLHQFIEQFNFATLISQSPQGLQVSHVPVLLDRSQGKQGALVWHLAKSNPHTEEIHCATEALFIFHGPHAYISPTWYKIAPSVPTWNYAVVRARGKPCAVSREQLSQDVDLLARQQEGNATYATPEPYKNKLLDYVSGFHMEIMQLEGTFKLGQNRSKEDQAGMLEGLRTQNHSESLALADFIKAFQSE